MKLPKLSLLLCRDPLLGDDHKVAVTLEIAAPEREPADQVGADEVLPENRLDAGDQFCEQLVQLRKYRRRGRRFLFSRHPVHSNSHKPDDRALILQVFTL